MLTVYSWPTTNGHKVHIMLEECGFRLGHYWQAVPVNIGTGEQFKPEFLVISPNNKIPALLDPADPDGKPIALFESGAILLYLAAKTGKFQQIQCLRPVQHCRHGYFSVAAQLAKPRH